MVTTQTSINFGNNPSLLSVLTNEAPQWRKMQRNYHLNVIAESTKAFIECKTNEN